MRPFISPSLQERPSNWVLEGHGLDYVRFDCISFEYDGEIGSIGCLFFSQLETIGTQQFKEEHLARHYFSTFFSGSLFSHRHNYSFSKI